MKLPKHFTQVTKLSKLLAFFLYFVVLYVGFQLGNYYHSNVQQNLSPQQDQVSQSNYDASKGYWTNVNRDIRPDSVEIKKIPMTSSWTNDGFLFQIKNAYLLPHIADIGKYYNYIFHLESGVDKQIVAVEVSVRNTRVTGEAKNVNFDDNFRIKNTENVEFDPDSLQLNLSPQEDTSKHFVYFPVEKSVNEFQLLAGPLSKPAVFNLDFNSEDSITLQGVFMTVDGFSQKYYERAELFNR